jgi:hypothetical protein
MSLKEDGLATDSETVDRFDGGVGWVAYPEETMRRASHAITVERDVWLVDPVDAEGIDDLLADLGEVRGVVVTMGRHARDAATLARRYDVPVHVPPFVNVDVNAPTEDLVGRLPDTDYQVVQTVDWPGWSEAALYDGETLVVGDLVGTADYFRAGPERVGVHPMLRLKPPHVLREFSPERILTGHGRGVMEDGTAALRTALDGARRRAPTVWLRGLRSLF